MFVIRKNGYQAAATVGLLRNEGSMFPYVDLPHYLVFNPRSDASYLLPADFLFRSFAPGPCPAEPTLQFNSPSTRSPMATQQARMFKDFSQAQQKLYQAKIDSLLALKRSYPHLSATGKLRSATLGNGCGLHADVRQRRILLW
ncbi:MAG: hypothetical protein WDM78_02225 [Puia sp.]